MKKKHMSTYSVIIKVFIVILSALLFSSIPINRIASSEYSKTLDLAPEVPATEITNPFTDIKMISYTEFRSSIATPTATAESIIAQTTGQNIKIRIDTAQELHRFSVDVSAFEDDNYSQNGNLARVTALLSLNYVLGNDIDYIDVTGNTFIPIGFNYTKDGIHYHQPFTGTFDGRGFEIKNLYLADYGDLVIIEDDEDIAVTPYYSMFSFNNGTIKNFGLVDPHFELRIAHDYIIKAAHIVGENNGTVQHVYTLYKDKEAGIMMRTQTGQTTSVFEAAGLVFDNKGTFTDSYYVGDVVINKLFIKNFSVQPVLFKTSTTTSNDLVYDSDIYKQSIEVGGQTITITPVNSLNTGKSTSTLKNGGLGSGWFYYPDHRYPAQFGLNEVSGNLQIHNGVEFIYFNKLLRLNYTDQANKFYREKNYKLMNHIDMREVSKHAYKTPLREFSGILDGNEKHMGYLSITRGLLLNDEYYAGLFSVLTGTVKNLTFNDMNITLIKREAFKMNYHIGGIAGTLEGAIIDNVKGEIDISTGDKAPKNLNMGLMAGDGTGNIKGVYINGDLHANLIYDATDLSNINYHIGGIIGYVAQTAQLKMENVLHIGDIIGPVSSHTTNIQSLNVYLGGVIGHTENTSIKHEFKSIMHAGTIKLKELKTNALKYYVGGVIGYSGGTAFQVSDENRHWIHRGTFFNEINNINTTTKQVIIGGVLNSNHSEKTEFIGLYNNHLVMNDSQQMLNDTYKNRYLVFRPLINAFGTSGIIVSQSKNTGNQVYDYQVQETGIISTNGPSLLRFVENTGFVTYQNFTYTSAMTISGITTSPNTDFLNVIHSGEISLISLTNDNNTTANYTIRVSGIANTLSSGYYMKNSYKEGNIIVANLDIKGSRMYVGGLLNENLSGDLETQDTAIRPKATKGVINSINYANITSTKSASLYGITGTGNVFAGGIAAFNAGSIQDSINHGNITLYNKYQNPSVVFSTDDTYGGRVDSYQSGIVIGGIVGGVTAGTSRVYDTSNGGNIVGVSEKFVRAGGIIGITFNIELNRGTGGSSSSSGDYDNPSIPDSIMSNGINYGAVYAITNEIGEYSRTAKSSMSSQFWRGTNGNIRFTVDATTVATEERLGINASSGGVIGYGLSEMRRMINHGQIVSTDVAGGVIGATFIRANTGNNTYVKIDTAINYGDVRAYKRDYFANFDVINFNLASSSAYFYNYNDDFVIPTAVSGEDLKRWPRHKRGIGGVFGRLQRGVSQFMIGDGSGGSQFDFIVNMNPNIDLIGRLDQVHNYTSSTRYFKFGKSKYYSAKENDTTQTVFTGFYYTLHRTSTISESITEVRYTKDRYFEYNEGTSRYRQYQGYGTTYSVSGNWVSRIRIDQMMLSSGGVDEHLNRASYVSGGDGATTGPLNWYNLGSRVRIGDANPDLSDAYFPSVNGKTTPTTEKYIQNSAGVSSNNYIASDFYRSKEIPWVTEDHLANPEAINIYDPAFEMRNDKTILSNGESITSYIYYAPNAILGERFKPTRPKGMYVLASTAGSLYGSTVPINTKLDALSKLDGNKPYDIDYESLDNLMPIDPISDPRYAKYKNLFQTYINDKSELLKNNQTLSFEETNTQFEISNPQIDHVNKKITIDYNMSLLKTGQTSIDLRIPKANIPYRAFISAPYDSNVHPDYLSFITALREEKLTNTNRTSSLIYPPNLSFNFVGNPNFTLNAGKYDTTLSQITLQVGKFRSYSEASLTEETLSYLTTDYDVYVNFKRAVTPNVRPISYRVDTGVLTNIPTTATFNPYIIDTAINNQILLNHRDASGMLNMGYDFSNRITLYYVDSSNAEHIVDKTHYGISATPVGTGGDFSSTITFSEDLKGGTYLIKFKYYEADSEKVIRVINAQNTQASITKIKHTYSDAISNPALNFTTQIPFMYEFSASDLVVTEHNHSVKPYLQSRTYSLPFLEDITISPFATLSSVTSTKTYLPTGYIEYQVTYHLLTESGTAVNYIHTLNEEEIVLVSKYSDGVVTYNDPLVAMRETDLTVFGFNYNIISDLYEKFYTLDQTKNAYLTVSNTEGYDEANYDISTHTLDIQMDSTVIPGDYTFNISFVRKDDANTLHTIDLGQQMIRKLQGTLAYLSDISFGEVGLEVSYPSIMIINEQTTSGPILYNPQNTNPQFTNYNNSYQPFIYYAGIDYNEADANKESHIRIIGELDNTDMTSYVPRMVENLPVGATIQKLYYQNGAVTYTTPIGKDATEQEIATLEADFTVYPRDGSEPDENSTEDVIITYVVTSEDGLHKVYYYVSVSDATYNITFIFNIFYMVNGVKTSINDITTFHNQPILVEVSNLDTGQPFTEVHTTVNTFPSFSNIIKYQNQMRMYYQALEASQITAYKFRFARNRAGYYQMNVDLPNHYKYEIFFNNQQLNNISAYVNGVEGKYFYINQGIRNRTRRLEIVIADHDYTGGWGLHQNDATYYD